VALGIQLALNFGPILLLGAWAGLLADRRDKRVILIGTQTAFAIQALALWVLVFAGVAQLWMVYALSLFAGIVTAIDNPARQSFYAEMVGNKDLTNAVSLNSAVMTGTRIVGPALAGVLIATVGLAPSFLFNAISYVAVIAALLAMRPDELHREVVPVRGKGQLREGLAYVRRTPGLLLPLTWMAVIFTFSFNFSVLFPVLATRVFDGDAGTYATMLSFLGVGSLLGALAMARQQEPNPRRLAVAAVAFGAATVLASAAPTFWSELMVLVPMGIVSMVFMITGNSTLQLSSRANMRGRVMALYGMVFLGGTPIGAPIAGWVADRFGPRMGIALGGLIAVVTGLTGLWMLSRRRLRRPRVAMARRPEVIGVPATGGPIDPKLATEEVSSRSRRQVPVPSGLDTSITVPSSRASRNHRRRWPSRSSIHDRCTSARSSTPPHTTVRGHSSARPPS
jgi:MFS family permease